MFQKIKTWAVAVPVLAFGAVGSAMAEVPTEVTSALTDLKTDALVVAGAVLTAIIAVYAVKFIRKGI